MNPVMTDPAGNQLEIATGVDSPLTRAVKANDASTVVDLLEDDKERIGDAITLAATCGCDEALLAIPSSPHVDRDAVVRAMTICIRSGGNMSTIQRLMCHDAEAGRLAIGLGVYEGRGDLVKQAIMIADGCFTLQTWQAVSKMSPGIPAPLTIAISNLDNDMLSLLLAVGLDPNVADYHTMTPLMHAAASCRLNAIKTLICYGADPTLEDVAGNTAIFWAIQGAIQTGVNTGCLAYFLANGCRATAKDLMAALKHCHTALVHALLVAGTRIDETPEGEACVIMACQDPTLLEMVLAHKRLSAPLDAAVITAAVSCQTDALDMLLADPRCPGYPTLHDALVNGAKHGHPEIVDMLLAKGVAPSTRVLQETVMGTSASSGGNRDEEQAVVRMLHRLAKDRRESLAVDMTQALNAAIHKGYADVARLLLFWSGVKPTRGMMQKAACRGDDSVCRTLLEAGGSPQDLLSAAIYNVNSTRSCTERIVRLAMSAGATVTPYAFFESLKPRVYPGAVGCMLDIHPGLANARTSDGRTALHVCASMGLWDLCAVLLDHGADPHASVEGYENVTAFHLAIDKTIFEKMVRWVTMRRQKARTLLHP